MPEIRGVQIEVDDFPRLVRAHRLEYPETPCVEKRVAEIVQRGFEPTECLQLVRCVCRWGGYQGIAARVARDNVRQVIAETLQEAHALLLDDNPVDALASVNRLKHLQQPSFASKHLRFLAPGHAVVLDSTIAASFALPNDIEGYRTMIAECRRVTAEINQADLEHPFRPNGPWLISDIELVFFVHLRGS